MGRGPDAGTGLVERARELDALRAAMAQALAGDGSLVVVEGPPGIGKSRLLQAARDVAPELGLRVLAARGGEFERDFPHGVTRQLLERTLQSASKRDREALLSGAAATAAAGLGLADAGLPAAPGDADFAVVHGLYWLVCNLAERGPLLLAVDDAHWSDQPSLRLLHYLARRLEGLPVTLLLAARTYAPGAEVELLGELAADAGVMVLRPATLSRAGTKSVVLSEFQTEPSERFVEACFAASGGNPFYLREMIAALKSDSVLPDDAGAGRASMVGPERVSRSVLMRLRHLPPEAGTLARAVATLGDAVELRHAAALAEVNASLAAELADGLADIEVLARGRPLRFVHPVILEAVRGDMGEAELAASHAAAARLLADAGAPADQVAAHLLLTDATGDPWIVSALRAAARTARTRGATDTAQRWLRRALAEGVEEGRGELLFELGEAEWLANADPVAAIEHLGEALELTTELDQLAEVALTLGRAYASLGNVDAATDVLYQTLERCRDASDDVRLALEAEWCSWGVVTPKAAQFAGERLDRYEQLEGRDLSELLLLCNLSAWRWLQASPTAVTFARRAYRDDRLIAAGGGDRVLAVEVVWMLLFADDHAFAAATLEKLLADARARGSRFAFVCTAGTSALLAWAAGDVRSCEEMARMGMATGPMPPFAHPSLMTFLGLALTERGELDEAEQVIADSWVGPHLPVLVHMNQAFYARGRLRKAQRRFEEALADFREQGERDARCHSHNPNLPWRLDAADCLVALDRPQEASLLIDQQLEAARRYGAASAIGAALHGQAKLQSGASRIGSLERAVAQLSASPARLVHAEALFDLGVSLRAAGRRSEATSRLREALQMAHTCGATALQTRVHAELRVLGARPRRLMFSGVESLTASERRAAKMAADGLTNRQIAQALFITLKTVEHHLSRTYRKLDITSREELAAALAGEPPEEQQEPASEAASG